MMPDRWEYQFVRVTPSEQGEQELTRLGLDGWRVVRVLEPARDPGALQVLLERRLGDGVVTDAR